MAATSVTGVGPGSAEGADKGRKEATLGVEKLVGPKVVAAGRTVLAAGAATVIVPLVAADSPNRTHIVMATGETAAHVYASVDLTPLANDPQTHVVVTLGSSNATEAVNWTLVEVGKAF